jgi:predicted nucleic acid-binding protein
MPEVPKRIYWDACIFLHFVEGTPQWMPILDSLLEAASESRDLIIVTSTLSITEVAFAKAEKDGKAPDPHVESAIDSLWNDRSAVQLVEYNEVIARAARSLLRQAIQSGHGLRPMDAIHLATAMNRNIEDFHTTDDRLKKLAWANLGFPIRDPLAR